MRAALRAAVGAPGLATTRAVTAAFGAQWARRRLTRLTRAAGIDEHLLVISLDCDTDHDIEVARHVHDRLLECGVRPCYAVAGELLERGAAVYRAIADTGAEFLNHGYREHARRDPVSGRVESTLFYDQLTLQEVGTDIRRGHEAVERVIGRRATGFRAPHFGTFQRPHHLRFQYRVLRQLGYAYSSSTVPAVAIRRGPLHTRDSLYEIPVTGSASDPTAVLDTWTYFELRSENRGPPQFLDEVRAISRWAEAQPAVLLNFYGDPSHIHDEDTFFEAVATLAETARSVTYTELLQAHG